MVEGSQNCVDERADEPEGASHSREGVIRMLSDRNKALLLENERLGAELYRIKVERNSLMYLLQSAPHKLVTKVKNIVGQGAVGSFLRKLARALTGSTS